MPSPKRHRHVPPGIERQVIEVERESFAAAPARRPEPREHPTSTFELRPASQFAWKELTDAYNQTRIDYIVPMPMNVERLHEYVHDYDVNLDASVVAAEDDQIIGLAMLGVRPGHTWATRLGVLPGTRQRGLGQSLMEYLLYQSRGLGADYTILEVIKGNEPAYQLFRKLGFRDTRELLILRRPPGRPIDPVGPYVVSQILGHPQALELLQERHDVPSWLDESPSLTNTGNLAGLRVELGNGERGWLVYRNRVFQLSHLVLQTETGDPRQVGQALLHALHACHPAQDTNTENIPADDPHLPALRYLHYLESFRRIEMRLDLSKGDGNGPSNAESLSPS